jgi:hypothetical protein
MAFGNALNEHEAQAAAWRKRFAAVPLEDKGGTWTGRYYQETAITRALHDAMAHLGHAVQFRRAFVGMQR